jgi:hypothetical protein
MCWNWKVSLGSFALISAVSYALYKRGLPNDKLLAIWLASYGSMQLFETFQWLGQNPGYEHLNTIGSIFAAFLLYLHPLAITTGMLSDSAYKGIFKNSTFMVTFYSSVAFMMFGAYRIISSYVNKTYTFQSKPDSISKHMVWEFPEDYYLSIVLIVIPSVLFIAPKYLSLFISGLIYFFLPIIIILTTMDVSDENRLKNYSGSYWCWYVAIFSFLMYFR